MHGNQFQDIMPCDTLADRHIGSNSKEIQEMVDSLGRKSLDDLINAAVPSDIRLGCPLDLPAPSSESETVKELRSFASKNQVWRSYIGMGYSGTLMPAVIQRNILENPGWYTAYTPYQPEISQGRLEALINFQTMITDLTGMAVANASLLDEGTAAAEAMNLCWNVAGRPAIGTFFVSSKCHPQTVDVVQTRACPLGISVVVGDPFKHDFGASTFGALLPYPATDGSIADYSPVVEKAHSAGAKIVVVADILSLALLRPPGEWGADVVVGSAQRFGVPMGYGGPHAAFFATRDEYKRQMPGRLIGVTRDAHGQPAYRLSLQTREQHIRRDKATSNICTSQVLLAVLASMFAVYHGPDGLKKIAARVHNMARVLAAALRRMGHDVGVEPFFDTVRVSVGETAMNRILHRATAKRINLRHIDKNTLAIALDETVIEKDLRDLIAVFEQQTECPPDLLVPEAWIPCEVIHEMLERTDMECERRRGLSVFELLSHETGEPLPEFCTRTSPFLSHPVFNLHHTELEMTRYIRRLESKDLSLTTSMIPLGSCTMKLSATTEMLAVTWREFADLHPFIPVEQAEGFHQLRRQLEHWLGEITGFDAVSLQPNAGSQGEYAGLLAIRNYHMSRKEDARTVCLIPASAHGTNLASAVMAGFSVVPVACDAKGNIDLTDLQSKAAAHASSLAALMITYPSTHGVFENTVREVCSIIHRHGGLVYMDGANMNAQVGLCRPADIGADVCHLNLHKTFGIPHGGGGPGVGPVCVTSQLAQFLPGHAVARDKGMPSSGAVASAPFGSAGVLPIAWAYIRMLGSEGLRMSTQVAILNANYIAGRLQSRFPVVYKGSGGLVAHECILDFRHFKSGSGVEVEDVAKRLMDFGFHAPTMSWPVPGTMMVEPTESESKKELDRFCDTMIAIHDEIKAIESGQMDKQNNPLKNAPHTAASVCGDAWDRPYSRELAAYPTARLRSYKYWPPVGRVDNVYGDRNLFCTCPTPETAT